MKYLVDTHVLIWWLDKNSPLTENVRAIIDDPDTEVKVSVATIWEIGIKLSTGKLKVPEDIFRILDDSDIGILGISVEHAYAVRSLPLLHKDPFDRMLVTQAMLEDLTLMTHDRRLADYAVPCMMV